MDAQHPTLKGRIVMDDDEMDWIDDGPVLRPYALTGGRTPPAASDFDLLAIITATGGMAATGGDTPNGRAHTTGVPAPAREASATRAAPPPGVFPPTGLGPEHHRILHLTRRPRRLVELAADVNLPLGVVRLLLSDLCSHDLLTVHSPAPAALAHDPSLLHEVLKGLRAL
ncbi:hypothetical protein Skr01_29940 [Sphaerisporangium krabiense]|uniref:DUF742 domain-containing protein n=1 Tax=Sphaerisporangium krabiense TaxID=763782 RepID=A0A7W8Z1Z6_9ACTN|nr:DUF742 domain-containing protein [Sphaerisporangium krabiense]MBB5625755.1 hypothetical protein [Sphaerisporangium krabiense]GII62909.1 hypothetical protein Skr01_29940 [Sphaerisporangium krabiense]